MATKAHLVIDQGTTFATEIQLLDENDEALNVTNFTARGAIRKHYVSVNSIAFSTNLSTGSLILTLSANQTTGITPGRYVYDVELIDGGGTVVRILEGMVTFTPEVTR